MDRIEAMRVFTRVVDMGSFAEVAKQMNVARSVVTRQISALEAHLGTKLLARSTRKLTLTSSGTLYLEKCREILNLVESAETDVSEESGIPRGPIRISLPLTYGVKHLAPLLLDFAQRYKEVRLSMDFSDRRVNLIEEGIDCAIRITGKLDPNDVVRKVGSCRMVVVASPSYLAYHGIPESPGDLGHHQCLGYTLNANNAGWTFFIEGQFETFYLPFSLATNNGEVLADAAAQGMGIALLPDFMVEGHVKQKILTPILETFTAPEPGIYALLPSNRLVPYRVRVLLEYLTTSLGKVA